MSKFSTYLIGYVIFVAGIALGANLLGVPSRWIAVVILVLVGLGIFAGATHTKRDDPPTA
jgi:Mn2+/Fe2+ NRAMP family transporter